MARKISSDTDYQSASRILALPDAVANDQPCTLGQALALLRALAWKDDVRVKSTGNVNITSPGTTIDSATMAANDRVLLASQTTQTENGLYIWNGSAIAMTRSVDASTFDSLESAIVGVSEGATNAGTQWRQTAVNGVLGTNNVVWTSFQASAPSASETTAGIAEIATQTETDTGTDDLRMVTPLKLATWSGRVRKATAAFGDGSATQYDITHNFATRRVFVRVTATASPWNEIEVETEHLDTNTVRLKFATGLAPTTNQYTADVWA